MLKLRPLWGINSKLINFPLKVILTQTHSSLTSVVTENNMELKTVVKKLNAFAPTSLAGSWDNVGLLVEPTPPHSVRTMLLTNDLTEPVTKEAIDKKADLILSYHPPIFTPMKSLTQKTWKERVIVKCIENRIAVFSPHTSYDAVLGGVNDWLIKPFAGVSKPLEKVKSPQYLTPGGYRLELTIPESLIETAQKLFATITDMPGVTVLAHIKLGNEDNTTTRLSLNCTEDGLTRAIDFVSTFEGIRETVEVLQLTKPPVPGNGPGRLVTLESPVTIQTAVDRVKSHLGLANVRLAKANGTNLDSMIKSVAVCAGSGGSVLRGIKADLYISGEMSHHELLDANHRGATVILCDHSNTERGFLREHRATLESMFDQKVTVLVSETDEDPLKIV